MASSFVGDMVAYVLKFVTRTIFIQTLGVDYLGIEGLFSNILSLLSLSELGFGTAISYKLYKPIAEGDTQRIRVLMRLYKYVYRGVGIAVAVLGVCCIPLLPILISDYNRFDSLGVNAVLVFALYLLQSVSTYLFFAYKSAIVRAHQKGYKLNVAGYAVTVVSCLAQIATLIFIQSFVLYVGVVILFNILQNLVYAAIAQKSYPEELAPTKEVVTREELIDLIKDCGSLFLYKTNGAVLKATDNIVISAILGLTSVGLYSNYLLIQNAIKGICSRVFSALDAGIGDLHARERGSSREVEVFRLANYAAFALYGLVSTVLFGVVNPFVSQWVGSDLTLGTLFVIPFCLETYFQGNLQFLTRFRTGMGLFQKAKFRPLFSASINLIVSIISVLHFGIAGVAIGSLVAHISAEFWYDALAICKHGFGRTKGIYGRYLVMNVFYFCIAAIAGLLSFALCNWIAIGGWAGVVLDCFISVAVFLLLALLLTCWSKEFKAMLFLFRRAVAKLLK